MPREESGREFLTVSRTHHEAALPPAAIVDGDPGRPGGTTDDYREKGTTMLVDQRGGGGGEPPTVEVVIPVHNEERDLGPSVRRLHAFLAGSFPFSFRVTIADNASGDGTWLEAKRLARELDHVRAVRLEAKGRGRALRAAWDASDAAVLAYMDVDLSTGLEALLPLVAPLVSGHSDLAIGTRLRRGARVVRGPKREVISRCYNLLLHATLGTRFSDAQCGFKAIRADAARALLPLVRDGEWFFDTELLVLAERSGLRIHEVPVDWVDDPDSRVDLVATAVADLKGVARLAAGLTRHDIPVAALRARLGRADPVAARGRPLRQVARFALSPSRSVAPSARSATSSRDSACSPSHSR
jgi:hypothetical protein